MNLLDIGILLALFFGLWQGFRLGLIRSLVSLFGWLFALVSATYFAKPMSPFFAGIVDSPMLTVVLAFIAIALIVIIVLQVVQWLLSKTMQGLKLSPLDKLGGAIFGCGKNLLAVLVLLSMLTPLFHNSRFWQDSQLVPEMLPFAPLAMAFSQKMASEVSQTTTDNLDKLSTKAPR